MAGEPTALLNALRRGGAEAEDAQRQLAQGAVGSQDERERLRAAVSGALAGDVRPTDRPIARWLLDQEIAAHVARGAGAAETLFTLVAVVGRFGQPSDALLLWRAHAATPETRAGVDVEQVGRLGVDAAVAWLERVAREGGAEAVEARAALEWIAAGKREGAFSDLPDYFTWADERFGLSSAGPT